MVLQDVVKINKDYLSGQEDQRTLLE